MARKKYLRFGKPTASATEHKFVGEHYYAFEWVDRLEDATAEDREAAEATQQRLVYGLNLETTLVEIQDTQRLESKWVICKEE
ncbi:MAG: hypothetical protein ABR953_10400 [Candidatus Acidiferrales bacterium]|jgi:hypothetical protein